MSTGPTDLGEARPTTHQPYAREHFANIVAAVRDPEHPRQIGPYVVEALIGQGGMGSVYKAQQHHPIRRPVAIKVIKLGMDTREVIARFDSERQALALMDHPNVARVIDAGATETGRPYFVMEHVDGEPITSFCDNQNYTVRQRLQLFKQACEGVQHAHQKAIIHRDLKPSNILVTLKDGPGAPGQVKVIDFGVAKAISQRLTQHTLTTETGQLLGTPEYMAPEQADGGAAVDTRSDVYSLGVILYELLTGALPFDPTTLRSGGYHEIQRIIREVDPPRPCTRLWGLGASGHEIAQRRQTPLSLLHQQLRRELEWIPLKAMRKEPSQRYSSPRELAEDIDNYLSSRPLRAGPVSRTYRLRKFFRRNKAGVGAAAIMVLLLVGGIVATSWQAIRASRERDNAQATLDFLTTDVLSGATPDNIPDARVRDQIISAMIAPAARRVSENFKDRPLIEASVRAAIQTVLREIGRSDLALGHAESALAIRRRLLGEDHPDTITSLHNYATVIQSLGRNAQVEPLQRDALDRFRRVLGEDDLKTLEALNNYAYTLNEIGRHAEAEQLFKEALERYRRVRGRDHLDSITALNNYASMLRPFGRAAEAESLYEEALEDCVRVLGNDHPVTIHAMTNYAGVLVSLNRPAEAAPLYKEVRERSRRVLGEDHPDTLKFQSNYAMSLRWQGRLEDAEAEFRQAIEASRRVLGADHRNTLTALSNYTGLLQSLGRLTEAELLARQCVASAKDNSSIGPNHPRTRAFATNHARILDALGRHEDAAGVRKEFGLPEPAARASTRPATVPAG
jgi:non-specific serine/threonine protein kinase/serine/threonine-protein kinase